MKPIPFDNVTLLAVAGELRLWIGAKVQRIFQPEPETLVLEWHAGSTAWFLASAHPVYFRAHLTTRRPANPTPTGFGALLRSRLEGAFLIGVEQPFGDRVLCLEFQAGDHRFVLVCELLGKHANLVLIDAGSKILGALKQYGPQRSTRPIQVGRSYPPIPEPSDTYSPFFRKWLAAGGSESELKLIDGRVAYLVPGLGAYPLPVVSLGYASHRRDSISIALEHAFESRISHERTESERRSLIQQLNRVREAREVALADLYEARDTAERAARLQRQGELILAYASNWTGNQELRCFDYDGTELAIRMDPELSALDNAQRYFSKAKKAKHRAPLVEEQITRNEEDLRLLKLALYAALTADSKRLAELTVEADAKRWRFVKTVSLKPEERPFEGHRIREYLGPGGFKVLVGENSAANDYLTLRVAKPDDWWLHVRGATSAHVIIQTHRKPERVSKEVFDFAARLAVKHSGQKHASYVPVDITQRRYVRRIKGSPLGTVQYTHERTLHVET